MDGAWRMSSAAGTRRRCGVTLASSIPDIRRGGLLRATCRRLARPGKPARAAARPDPDRRRTRRAPHPALQPSDGEGLHRVDPALRPVSRKRHPREMGAAEATRFLTALAVEGRVTASTQNQALSALLFLRRWPAAPRMCSASREGHRLCRESHRGPCWQGRSGPPHDSAAAGRERR